MTPVSDARPTNWRRSKGAVTAHDKPPQAMTVVEQLQRGCREIKMPARLNLAGGETLECEETLRVLPGKRAVMKARWRERPVLVKLILDTPSGRRNVRRELSGYRALKAADIATPERLLTTRCREGHHVLGFAFMQQARRLGDRWRSRDERLEAATAGLGMIALLHRNACRHTDPHFDNFLLAGGRIYVVDVASVERCPNTEYGRWQRKNLAFFLAQFSPLWRKPLMDSLPEHYPGAAADPRLEKAVARAWRRRTSKYLKKCVRECGDFSTLKTRRRFAVWSRAHHGADLDSFVRDPDAWVAKGELLKDGNSATVVVVQLDGRPVVIKRNNIKNARHWLRRCLRPTRGCVNWRNAHLLGLNGIATPEPVAFVEKRRGPFRLGGYYVCAWCGFPSAAHQYQSRQPGERELKWFEELFAGLRSAKIVHGDLKASNLLVTDNGISLIDLDSMKEASRRGDYQRLAAKDRRRFLENWKDRPGLRELFAGVFSEGEPGAKEKSPGSRPD